MSEGQYFQERKKKKEASVNPLKQKNAYLLEEQQGY